MKFNIGDKVIVNKNLYRYDTEGIYAEAGEVGVIIDIFRSYRGKWIKRSQLSVKIKIGDKIKTVKLSSIEKLLD